jgi:hypothetical protein
MYSASTWLATLTGWMATQNSQTEYFFVTREGNEGSARYWLFLVERQTWDNVGGAWGPRRKCLSISIRPRASTSNWPDFSERAAQDASNIARRTPNISYLVGDVNYFYGCKVVIDQGSLITEPLPGAQNMAFGATLGPYIKGLATYNDNYMKSCGD